jgi:gliding motility-associated-like protein
MKKLITLAFAVLLFFSNSNAQNCNSAWIYRVPITVSNSGSSISGLQVKITINTSTPIAASKMNAAGNDIRFVDNSCTNLNYWIESGINTASTIIWVKTGTLATGNNQIYLMYGNSGASAASSGTGTFDLFDDFTGATLNASVWNTYLGTGGSVSVSGGAVNFSSGNSAVIRSVATVATPNTIEIKVNSSSAAWPSLHQVNSGTFQGYGMVLSTGLTMWNEYCGPSGASYYGSLSGTSTSAGTTVGIWTETWQTSGSNTIAWPSGSNSNTLGTYSLASSTHITFGMLEQGAGSMSVDWARTRKATTATIGVTINAEEYNPLLNVNRTVLYDGFYNTTVTNLCGGNAYVHNLNLRVTLVNATLTFEMSDGSGSFSSPYTLASFSGYSTSFNSTDLPFYVTNWPNNLPYGTGYKYRIKVTSSALNYTGDPSTFTNTLGATPTSPNFTINSSAQCDEIDNFKFTGSANIATGNSLAYSWNFGDATTGTGSTPSHGYNGGNVYTVTLNITNASLSACAASPVQKNVTVYSQPVAQAYDYSGWTCEKASIYYEGGYSFVNNYPGNSYISTYNWDFGDATTGTTSYEYQKTYSTYGDYNVVLVVTTNNGCKDTASFTHKVLPNPKLSWTNDLACDGRGVQFHSDATVNSFAGSYISSYNWNMGDASSTTDRNPLHLFPAAGNYSVYEITYSQYGCWDTLRKTVTVNPSPKAAFSATNVCKGAASTITNTSSISTGTLSYLWRLGNGTTSTATNPAPVYSQQGAYDVRLIATANTGCTDSTTKPIVVYGLPTAQFASADVCLGTATPFTNYSVGNATQKWTFLTGQTSTAANPTYTYAADGTYPVKLVVTSADGCKDSITKSALVNPVPTSNFSNSTASTCLASHLYTFTNLSAINSGTYKSSWAFGDNTVSTAVSPTKKYATEGSYTVTLTNTSDKGCVSSTASQTVTVAPMPVIKFSFNNTCENTSVPFLNSSTVATGSFGSFLWSFGDATTSAVANPSHTYPTKGNYTVTLDGTTDKGCKGSASAVYTAWPNPVASFTGTDECSGLANRFTNTSSVSPGFIVDNTWNFGDFTTGHDLNPLHQYQNPGAYGVQLTVMTDKGCSNAVSHTVNSWPRPVANFTVSNVCQGLASVFTNTSTVSSGSITNTDWGFGDGSTSTVNSPSHTYATFGNYLVGLQVKTDKGCTDNKIKEAKVFRQPIAHIGASTLHTSVLEPVIDFTDNSSFGDYSAWDFGFNGRTSNFRTDTCAYTKPGSYLVRLNSSTIDGCSNKDSVTVKIDNAYTIYFPNAFTPNNDNLNEGFGAVGIFEGIATFSMNILDNKGRVLYTTTDIHKKWNGKIDNTGEDLPNGNFAWFVEYTDFMGKKHSSNGIVTLRR